MPLSERDKITISNTISGYISNIPVHTIADFPSVIEALQLLKNGTIDDTVSSDIKNKVSSINNYMDPDFCAVLPKNRREFLTVCNQIIDNRVQYLKNLSSESKLIYINQQIAHRNEVSARQEIMSRAIPPVEGSEAYVISEEAMLLQQQLAFDLEEAGDVAPTAEQFISLLRATNSLENEGFMNYVMEVLLHRQREFDSLSTLGGNSNSLFARPEHHNIKQQCNRAGIEPSDNIINTYLNSHQLVEAFNVRRNYQFNHNHVNVLKFLIDEKNYTVGEAFKEITGIFSVGAIHNYYATGIRNEHIRQMELHIPADGHFDEVFGVGGAIFDIYHCDRIRTANEIVEAFKSKDLGSLRLSMTID